ncbi:metal-dependent hydrolase [Microbacterium sp. 10M-3C3]|jgi:alanyl-tRNA synthetase|uniref:metal-dependent hydrolase n=1 Tax=Microbacterium sp. 10M-3C3 TaxID=2483401 RepID=UPI000F62E092|nr:metal-dependent hydrolase [Microbacterium sp. 10M-3C3]
MIEADTRISYPDGDVTSESAIVHVQPGGAATSLVVLAATAAHPVDPTWPDQGPDRGTLTVGGSDLPLQDVRIGAWDGTELHVGDRLPARLGTEGWRFVVVHEVPADAALEVGATAVVHVDERHRRSLSLGHTACHVASLALNAALADRWTKDARRDALGAPDFDGIAIQRSVIRPWGSTDTYRLGKSLRRSGFRTEGLGEELDEIARRIDERLAGWVASDAAVWIERPSDALTARRSWHCALPEQTAVIPCGGTHARHLGELGAVTVRLALDDSGTELTMETDARPAGTP